MFGYQEYRRLPNLKLTLFCDMGFEWFVVVFAVAVDEDNGYQYWGHITLIKQSTLDGTDIKDVVDAGKLNIMCFM